MTQAFNPIGVRMGPQWGKLPLNTQKMTKILQKYTHAKLKWKISIYVIIEGVISGTGARCRYRCGGLKNLTLLGVGRGMDGVLQTNIN